MDPHNNPTGTLLALTLGFNLTLALSLAIGYRGFGGHHLENYGRLGRTLAGAGIAFAVLTICSLTIWLALPPGWQGILRQGWWLVGWLHALPLSAAAAAILGMALYDRVMALGALAVTSFFALIWLGWAIWIFVLMLLPALWLISIKRLPIALPDGVMRFLYGYGLAGLFPALPLLIPGLTLLKAPGPDGAAGLLLVACLHVPVVLAFAALLRLEDTGLKRGIKAKWHGVAESGDAAASPIIGGLDILGSSAAKRGDVNNNASAAAINSSALQRSIADLPEGIAIFDPQDRLIAVNIVYFHLHSEFANELKPGAHYADLTRFDVLRHGLTFADSMPDATMDDPTGGGEVSPLQPESTRPRDRSLPFAITDTNRATGIDGIASNPAMAAASDSADDPEALIAALLDRHRHLPWRQELRRPNGQWLRIIESRSVDGGTLRIVSDITAIKARELRLTQLAERNAVLATAIASVTSGIVICDAREVDQPISFVNAAFCKITGYRQDEVLGRNCRFLQGRDTDPAAVEKLRRAIDQKRPAQVTLRNYRKDGKTFWNDLHISPVIEVDGSVRQFVGIINDATARMRTEESLREAKNLAEIANRTKTEFLANISHELRTPLNAIIGFSEVMQLGLFGPLGAPQYSSYVGDIHDSGQLLLSLINDLLDLSKIEAGRYTLSPERCSIADLIDSSMRLVRERALAGSLKLTSRIDPQIPDLWADRRAALQIIANLLTNAIKFTPKDGEVKVDVAPTPSLGGGAPFVTITVSDTGIGIDKADIPKVLSVFGQVDNAMSRQHQGTGLGLPIVKALVELHGGTLDLDSVLGEGTSVKITLPALADSVVQPNLL